MPRGRDMIFQCFLLFFFAKVSKSVSTGPSICDALGPCFTPSSGAAPRTDLDGDASSLSPTANLAIVVDGCSDSGTEYAPYILDVNDTTTWNDENGNFAACCSGSGSNVLCHVPASPNQRPNGVNSGVSYCNTRVSFEDAKNYCESYDMRLCTYEEVDSGICCDPQPQRTCQPQNRQYWTEGHVDYYRCPLGMDKVAPPVRHDGYSVYAESTSYVPGEAIQITVEVVDPTKKYLGLMMYAVVNDDDSYGPDGCPPRPDGIAAIGCNGNVENRVGTWETNGSTEWKVGSVYDECIVHSHAALKKFKETFTWIPPDAGFGEVIFRVLIKHGSTNGGMFYWPMQQDLVLQESTVASSPAGLWRSGPVSKSCTDICADDGRLCSMSANDFTSLDAYNIMKHDTNAACQTPLLSSCVKQGPTKESSSGMCWLQNFASHQCPGTLLGVACCGNGAKECGSQMTLQEAKTYCSDKGMQICSRSELSDCSNSCQQAGLEYWTNEEINECASPAERLCMSPCVCSYDTFVGRFASEMECLQEAYKDNQEAGNNDAKFTFSRLRTAGDNSSGYACYRNTPAQCEEAIMSFGNQIESAKVWVMDGATSVAETLCENCKCGGPTDIQVNLGSDGSVLECQETANRMGYAHFSYHRTNNRCLPSAPEDCAEDSRNSNTNWDSYFTEKISCEQKIYVAECGQEATLIDIPAEVSPVDNSQDICSVTASEGGDLRLCQCGVEIVLPTHSPSKMPTAGPPSDSSGVGNNDQPSSADDSGSSTIAIVLIIVGSAIFICCVCFICLYLLYSRSNEKKLEGTQHDFSHIEVGGGNLTRNVKPTRSLEGAPSVPTRPGNVGTKTNMWEQKAHPAPPPPPKRGVYEQRF